MNPQGDDRPAYGWSAPPHDHASDSKQVDPPSPESAQDDAWRGLSLLLEQQPTYVEQASHPTSAAGPATQHLASQQTLYGSVPGYIVEPELEHVHDLYNNSSLYSQVEPAPRRQWSVAARRANAEDPELNWHATAPSPHPPPPAQAHDQLARSSTSSHLAAQQQQPQAHHQQHQQSHPHPRQLVNQHANHNLHEIASGLPVSPTDASSSTPQLYQVYDAAPHQQEVTYHHQPQQPLMNTMPLNKAWSNEPQPFQTQLQYAVSQALLHEKQHVGDRGSSSSHDTRPINSEPWLPMQHHVPPSMHASYEQGHQHQMHSMQQPQHQRWQQQQQVQQQQLLQQQYERPQYGRQPSAHSIDTGSSRFSSISQGQPTSHPHQQTSSGLAADRMGSTQSHIYTQDAAALDAYDRSYVPQVQTNVPAPQPPPPALPSQQPSRMIAPAQYSSIYWPWPQPHSSVGPVASSPSTSAANSAPSDASRKHSVSNSIGPSTPRSGSGSELMTGQSRQGSTDPADNSKADTAAPVTQDGSGQAQSFDFAAANEMLIDQRTTNTSTKRAKTKQQNKSKSSIADAAHDDDQAGLTQETTTGKINHHRPRRGSRRSVADEYVNCVTCGKIVAKFILRGTPEDLTLAHTARFKCMTCHGAEVTETSSETVEGLGGATNDTQHMASVAEDVADMTKAERSTSKPISFRKRHNKRVDSGSTRDCVTACDVCLRDVAVGAVVAEDGRTTIDFYVEVVCAACDQKYQRCSDCGGGGGVRLGVGKWRSKQLFPPDRKTCRLSHSRLGALSDMIYDIHFVGDIPKQEIDDISAVCGRIFANTMFGSICIPEVLEQQHSIAKSYEEVAVMAMRGWQGLEPLIRHNPEPSLNRRRYLAIRLCAPNPRKAVSAHAELPQPSGVVLRAGKEVAGFVISEWDMDLGSVFLAVVVPWAMGEVYDATTILIQKMFQHIDEDRDRLSQERVDNGLPPLPFVDQTWTMMFFKRDSRMIQHLSKKRGFMYLEDYMKLYPDTNRDQFPPTRRIYLPVERQQGWSVMVKRKPPKETEFFPIRRTASSAAVERKVKEQKARSRRAEQAE
ncbi:hypothetical protein OIO90_000759 [Microbotryomycetes sp. JL221]|nr:hypothetical protein OIO90_000759 [Microbotryomycetes sp. JL221]